MKRILLLLFSLHLTAHLSVADTVVRIGSNPNIWFPQTAVIIGEGWDRKAGIELQLKQYPGPAHNLQGFVAGEVDGVTNNVAAAMLAQERGKKLKVVAGTLIGDISLIVHPEVTRITGNTPLEKLQRFAAQHGRRFRLVTNPRGSLSEITMRRWLESTWPQFETGIELIHAGDQATMQQLFFSRAVDGCAGFGSHLWLFQSRSPEVTELMTPDQLMPNQPGGVLMVTEEFTKEHPEIVRSLQQLFARASELIRSEPERAAVHIDALLTNGLVPVPILVTSLKERKEFVESDLAKFRSSTASLAEYMVQAGYLKQVPDLEQLFFADREVAEVRK